jgi:hypothetical protein
VKRKSDLKRLAEAVRQAEAELDAAAKLSDVMARCRSISLGGGCDAGDAARAGRR